MIRVHWIEARPLSSLQVLASAWSAGGLPRLRAALAREIGLV